MGMHALAAASLHAASVSNRGRLGAHSRVLGARPDAEHALPDAEDRCAAHVSHAQRGEALREAVLGTVFNPPQRDGDDKPDWLRHVPDVRRPRQTSDTIAVAVDPSFFSAVSPPNWDHGRDYHADTAHATTIHVKHDATIEEVRERVAQVVGGVPPDWVRLRFAGPYVTKVKAYPPGRRTLRELGVREFDVIHATPRAGVLERPEKHEPKAQRRARDMVRAAIACGAAHEPWETGAVHL